MARCPHCQQELPQPRPPGGTCPACGCVLATGGRGGKADAPKPPEDSTDSFAEDGDGFHGEAFTPAASDTGPAAEADEGLHRPGTKTATADEIKTLWGEHFADDSRPDGRIKPASSVESVHTHLRVTEKAISQPGEAAAAPADFEVRSLLGEGGMGMVYEARQASVDRIIALKMIKPHLATHPQQRTKFLAEAAVTSDLDHPNIVPIHDLGAGPEGRLYYAMKRVQGTPWSQEIRRKSLQQNLEILLDVADAVAYAHAKGIIHRDLKPHNVMLGAYGEVVLMDWGLAAAVREGAKAEPLTRATAAGGTPAYMAPEMARADADRIGTCSDIYQLGAILYEILSGRAPHGGDQVIGCLVHAANNRIRPTEKKGELLDIALKAMATDPADRYPAVQDLQQAVRSYLDHEQSIRMGELAEDALNRARTSGTYDDFSEALYGFREALKLWDANERAREHLAVAQLAYAENAFAKGDYDLAGSLLDADRADHARFAHQIREAQQEREARLRRLRVLKRTAVGLAAAIIAILAGACILIYQESMRARRAEAKERQESRRARSAEQVARQEQRRAEREALRARRAREAEAEQRRVAEVEREKARAAEVRAVETLEALMRAESREEQATARAKAAELMAAEAHDELAEAGLLRDNAWWTFDADAARKRQQQAAAQHGLPVRRTISLNGDVELALVLVPPGAFVMGSPPEETERAGTEYLHRVKLTRPFYLSPREITEAEWHAVTDTLPRGETPGSDAAEQPVREVSWHDIQEAFLPRINRRAPEGFRFRLPTEAEWEYACRAGTATPFYTGRTTADVARAAWYLFSSGRRVHPVGRKAPNPWGLYDMHGNVSEWCWDAFDPNFYLEGDFENPWCRAPVGRRVIRGGGCLNLAEHCRSAYRSWAHSKNRYKFLGFRLACVPDRQTTAQAGGE